MATKMTDLLKEYVPSMLARRAGTLAPLAAAAGGGPGQSLDFSGEHRVYAATLPDVIERKTLQKAKPVGWRYIVLSGNTAVATAQVSGKSTANVQFSNVNYSNAASTVRAIATAEERGQLTAKTELRVLEIPGIYLVALWLHTNARDVLIPLDPAPDPLRANQSYPAGEFVRIVRGIAADRVKRSPDALKKQTAKTKAKAAKKASANKRAEKRRPRAR